jgi:hypothetical protein
VLQILLVWVVLQVEVLLVFKVLFLVLRVLLLVFKILFLVFRVMLIATLALGLQRCGPRGKLENHISCSWECGRV